MKKNFSRVVYKKSSQRLDWADFCRVISVFGIILIHACIDTFKLFGHIPQSEWLIANLFNSLARCAVPLFVMLSGALLLKADPAYTEHLTIRQIAIRASKVLLPLISWNVFYLLYLSHHTGEPVRWLSMFSREPVYHLWFVYMIIGIYILLPVLQAIFQLIICKKVYQVYLLVFWLVVTSIPIYQPIPLLNLLQQTSLFGYGGYFLMGGVIALSENNRLSSLIWLSIYVFGVVTTFFLTFYFSMRADVAVETAYNSFAPNVFISSVAAFILFSRVKIEGRFRFVLEWVSDRSFLIFFMHVIVLERAIRSTFSFFPELPVFLVILAATVATFIICLAIATVLRLLPGSKTLLG